MGSSPLRVGAPALADGSPPPIEGARLLLDGPALRLLIVYEEPTVAEIATAKHAPVDLGVYHSGGLAALAVRIGESGAPGLIEAFAPLVLPGLTGSDAATAATGSDPPAASPVEIALCDAERTAVRAIRSVVVPAEVVRAAHQAALTLAPRFESVADGARALEWRLRHLTVDHLLHRADVRVHIA